MERKYKKAGGEAIDDNASQNENESGDVMEMRDHVKRMQIELEQKDNEIAILIQHLEKKRSEGVPVTSFKSEEEKRMIESNGSSFYNQSNMGGAPGIGSSSHYN